jgi:hypothetical protein
MGFAIAPDRRVVVVPLHLAENLDRQNLGIG